MKEQPKNENNQKDKMNTNHEVQSLNMVGLREVRIPLLQAEFQGKNLLFMLDSGSDMNFLDEWVVEHFKDNLKIEPDNGTVLGVEGKEMPRGSKVIMPLEIKGHLIKANFYSIPGGIASFDLIEQENHVRIHGILGTPFMVQNNLVIDFSNYTIRFAIPGR